MKAYALFLILFLFSCTGNSNESPTEKTAAVDSISAVDTLSRVDTTRWLKDTVHRERYINHPTGYKDISKFVDTSINGIRLNDCDTIDKLFGEDYKLLPDIDDLPAIQILNRNNTQLLTMYMWNGNAKCYFSQYQVEYSKANKKYIQDPFKLNADLFVSGRKISLGMSETAVKEMLGAPNEVKNENGAKVLSYQQYDDLYFADYYFVKNKLIKFRFGFEYP